MVFAIVVEMWIMVWLLIYPDRMNRNIESNYIRNQSLKPCNDVLAAIKKFIHYKEEVQEHQMIVQDMMQDNTNTLTNN